jgi:alpha-tubulin suppressor-like RCC1 family protein
MLEMMNLGSGASEDSEGIIKKFGVGAAGFVALTKTGNLYGLGAPQFSGTGANSTIWNLLGSNITDVWVSYQSVLVRDQGGRWLLQGVNNYFPTSLGSDLPTLTDVSSYFSVVNGKVIKSVSLGFRSLAIVFQDGSYAMCGFNGNGGLGLGNSIAQRDGPVLRTDFTNVKKIEFDWVNLDTSYMLLEDGNIYVAGSSSYGQAGVTTGNVTTWREQTFLEGTVDISAATNGYFRIVEDDSSYKIYAQGRQVNGSLGTATTSTTVYTLPKVLLSIPDKSRGIPTVYVGNTSARFNHPEGKVYFTGTGTGDLQGTNVVNQPTYYSFVPLSGGNTAYGAEFFALRGYYTGAYALKGGVLYGVGQSANTQGYLPGSNGAAWRVFTELNINTLV